MHEFPQALLNLTKLTRLVIEAPGYGDEELVLPEGITVLRHLRELRIYRFIPETPQTLRGLTSLTRLTLDNFGMSGFLESLTFPSGLHSLILRGTQPQADLFQAHHLDALTNLRELVVDETSGLAIGPSITRLSKLSHIWLDMDNGPNSPANIADELFQLPMLRRLRWGFVAPPPPEALAQATGLRELIMLVNGEIPDVIFSLTALTCLKIQRTSPILLGLLASLQAFGSSIWAISTSNHSPRACSNLLA